jgi:hypothetical protein
MIDGGGYATAATAFAEANAVAAMQHDHLVGALGGSAGMAGHDPVAAEFAAAYDDAATEALAGYADLVTALANLGHLTEASLARHLDAERASFVPGSVVYDGGSLVPGTYASVLRATPPAALGTDATSLASPAQEWVLDQLEGIFLPSGDPGALRAAAQSWRTAATGLTSLTGYADTATRGLEQQLSPEIPLALDAVADLSAGIADLAAQYAALADACDAFAANVEARRDELVGLLEELVEMAVEGALVSVGVGLLTGGIGAGASGTAFAARLAARYPRFAAVVALFRSVAAETTAALHAVRDALALRRARLVRYLTARIALRGERGTLGVPSAWRRLRRWEDAGGHLTAKHIGRSDRSILRAAAELPAGKSISTFTDGETAVRAIDLTCSRHAATLEKWLEGSGALLRLEQRCPDVVGRIATHGDGVRDGTVARVILRRAPELPEGFRVHTAYVID